LAAPASATTGNSGFRWDCLPYDAAAWIVAGWLIWGLFRLFGRNRPELVCLAIGWIASLLGFFVVAGPGALAPNFERYAIWIVAPTTILAAIAIVWWHTRPGRAGKSSTILAIALGWTLLFSFQTNCLEFLWQTGGRSHRTFRTAAIEPKQAALAAILARREARENVRIVASEWWIYWPMRYLSLSRRTDNIEAPVTVEMSTATRPSVDSGSTRMWRVEFADSEACESIRQNSRAAGKIPREITISDFTGRPILTLFDFSSTPVSGKALAAGDSLQTSGLGK
jgi:hypothetical protein